MASLRAAQKHLTTAPAATAATAAQQPNNNCCKHPLATVPQQCPCNSPQQSCNRPITRPNTRATTQTQQRNNPFKGRRNCCAPRARPPNTRAALRRLGAPTLRAGLPSPWPEITSSASQAIGRAAKEGRNSARHQQARVDIQRRAFSPIASQPMPSLAAVPRDSLAWISRSHTADDGHAHQRPCQARRNAICRHSADTERRNTLQCRFCLRFWHQAP
jgi:hypothetical protein